MNKKLYSIVGLDDNRIYKYYSESVSDAIEKHKYYLALMDSDLINKDYTIKEHNKYFSIEHDNKTYCIKK
jgi:hypothetical protein